MWLLHLLPTSLIQACVMFMIFGGIAIYVISEFTNLIPSLSPYVLLIRLVGICSLAAGIYCYGGYSTEVQWRDRVAKAEAETAEMKIKADNATQNIETIVVERQKEIKDKQKTFREEISVIAPVINVECKMNPTSIDIINRAARSGK